MKRWFGDPLFKRVLLLALVLGALSGVDAAYLGQTYPGDVGFHVALGVMIGAAAMRLWTWKDKP
jgi:hypothetical protein